MENPTGSRAEKGKRYGIFIGGGLGHVRYEYEHRPAKIDIKCPKCSALAFAKENGEHTFSGDLSDNWNSSPFSILCTKCLYREENLSYQQLTEPYYQIEGRGEILWAWNIEHLQMIYKFLKDEPIKNHKYEFFHTYIHGDWKKYKQFYIKAIEKFISQENISFPL